MITSNSISPYVEPPTVPEGMTVEEYRRARLPRRRPQLPPLLDWLSHLVGVRQGRLA